MLLLLLLAAVAVFLTTFCCPILFFEHALSEIMVPLKLMTVTVSLYLILCGHPDMLCTIWNNLDGRRQVYTTLEHATPGFLLPVLAHTQRMLNKVS